MRLIDCTACLQNFSPLVGVPTNFFTYRPHTAPYCSSAYCTSQPTQRTSAGYTRHRAQVRFIPETLRAAAVECFTNLQSLSGDRNLKNHLTTRIRSCSAPQGQSLICCFVSSGRLLKVSADSCKHAGVKLTSFTPAASFQFRCISEQKLQIL